MKIVILGSASSIHIVRWANALAQRGHQLHLIGKGRVSPSLDESIVFHELKIGAFNYFWNVFRLRYLLRKLKPDILNAHYATSYGLLARLSNYKPLLLSVWGSDVYEFPSKSKLHKALLRGNLKSSTAIGSTSFCMKRKAAETFEHEAVFVTPFGIDVEKFTPGLPNFSKNSEIVIGTIKSLTKKYGVDTLISSFAIILNELKGSVPVRLEITGAGPDLAALQGQVEDLGIQEFVKFNGSVDHDQVEKKLRELDIYVALSRSESFGVAILEASACGKPVIVSDAEGPAEVTINNITGLIVEKDNPVAAAKAILKLINNDALRLKMGQAGREHVLASYGWGKSVDIMLDAYAQTIEIENRKK